MENRDYIAGGLLKELREDLGLSREELPKAMLRAGIDRRNIPSVRTIQRIEEEGVRPIVRYRFGLAQFHDRKQSTIWQAERVTV
jgi:transcriptional regulator with XRE-family HTH domain